MLYYYLTDTVSLRCFIRQHNDDVVLTFQQKNPQINKRQEKDATP